MSDSRSRFEKWILSVNANDGHTIDRIEPGEYRSAATDCAWEAWQAAGAEAGELTAELAAAQEDARIAMEELGCRLTERDEARAEAAALRDAIGQAVIYLGPVAPECSGCEYEWNAALNILNAAIDQAKGKA